MDCSMPGFPVLHHLPELAQIHVHWVGDVIQPVIYGIKAQKSSFSRNNTNYDHVVRLGIAFEFIMWTHLLTRVLTKSGSHSQNFVSKLPWLLLKSLKSFLSLLLSLYVTVWPIHLYISLWNLLGFALYLCCSECRKWSWTFYVFMGPCHGRHFTW